MSITVNGKLNIPNVVCLSSDVVGGKIAGANPGQVVFYTDTAAWMIVKNDLTLASYAIPATFGGTISLGAVSTGDSAAGADGIGNYVGVITTTGGAVNSSPLMIQPILFNGATWDRQRVPTIFKDVVVAITNIATVWTPGSGLKFRLMGGSFSVSAGCSVLFEDNAAGAGNFVFRTPLLVANTPYTLPSLGNGVLSSVADKVLKATASTGTVTLTGTLFGTEE